MDLPQNAWRCLQCGELREFKDVCVYCVRKTDGTIAYYLEGTCVVTNIKGACFIGKNDLKTAGVRLSEPRAEAGCPAAAATRNIH